MENKLSKSVDTKSCDTNLSHWQEKGIGMLDTGSDLVDQALPAFLTLPLTPVGFFQHFHNLIVYNRREG